jgi:hypothetical protein
LRELQIVPAGEADVGIFSWFAAKVDSTRSPEEPGWLRRWVIRTSGRDDPKLDTIKRAAAEDVAELEAEDREYFRRDGPGHQEDDL